MAPVLSIQSWLDQIQKELLSALDRQVSAQVAPEFGRLLSLLERLLEQATAPITKREPPFLIDDLAEAILGYLAFFEALPQWNGDLIQELGQVSPKLWADSWEAQLKQSLALWPSKLDLELTDPLVAGPAPSLRVGLWMWSQRRRFAWARFTRSLANRWRAWRSREALAEPQFYRSFSLAGLLATHLGTPLYAFWLEESGRWAADLAELYGQLGEAFEGHNRACWALHGLLQERSDEAILQAKTDQESLAERLRELCGQLVQLQENSQSRLKLAFERQWADFAQGFLYAGGWGYPASRYRPGRAAQAQKQQKARAEGLTQAWAAYWTAWDQDQKKDGELYLLSARAAAVTQDLIFKLLQVQGKAVNEQIDALHDHLISWRDQQDPQTSIDQAGEQLRALTNELRYQLQPQLLECLKTNHPKLDLQAYRDALTATLAQFPAEMSLLQERQADPLNPKTKTRQVAFYEIIDSEIFSSLKERLDSFWEKNGREYTAQVVSVHELDQLLDVNFGSVLLRIRDEGTAPVDRPHLFTDAMGRALDRLDHLAELDQKLRKQTRQLMQEETSKLGATAQALVDHEKVLSLQLMSAKVKGRERLHQIQRSLQKSLSAAWPQLVEWTQSHYQKLSDFYQQFRQYTGLTVGSAQELRLKSLISESRDRIFALPHVYRHLFRNEPLADDRFFLARQAEMAVVSEVFEKHQAQGHGSLAVVGAKGAGKSSLWQIAQSRAFGDYATARIKLEHRCLAEADLVEVLCDALGMRPCPSLSEIEADILTWTAARVVGVESLDRLFLRVPGGFELLRQFILLQHQTQAKILWINFCGELAWNYLDRVVQISHQFEQVLSLSTPSPADLKELVLRRHQLSGFHLKYSASAELAKSKSYREASSEEERQGMAQAEFFETLAQVSGANIGQALFHWVRAVESVEDQTLVLSSEVRFNLKSLSQLSKAELFCLQAVLLHERLSVSEQAQVFRINEQESRYRFDQLVERGILVDKGGAYGVQALFQRPLVQILKDRNLLE
ncbi:MAG: hypothetical protein RRB13_04440 [bacterium]|nr:hypothetical protein [bacterium]